MNFKKRTLRSTNNFINLSLAGINILLACLYNQEHKNFFSIVFIISTSILGALPIYYFYKQFSNKGKYINIIPLSMKKIYLITLFDWLIIYLLSTFFTFLISNFIGGNDIYSFLSGINGLFMIKHILGFIKINLIIASVLIIIKFYKINWLLVLGGFIGIEKIIDILFSLSVFKRQSFGIVSMFSSIPSTPYLIVNFLMLVPIFVLFFFMTTKLDKLSIE